MAEMRFKELQHATGMDPDEILTIPQAARVLKVSYSHMLRLVRGEVPGMLPVHHVRAGRSLRVRRGALAEWVRQVEKLRSDWVVQQVATTRAPVPRRSMGRTRFSKEQPSLAVRWAGKWSDKNCVETFLAIVNNRTTMSNAVANRIPTAAVDLVEARSQLDRRSRWNLLSLAVTLTFSHGLLNGGTVENTSNIRTINEVANILGCSKTYAVNVLDAKPEIAEVGASRLGRRKVVRKEWLDEWMENKRQ